MIFRCLTWEAVKKSVVGALRVTLMAYLIVFGSATFSQLLAFSGGSRGLINWATGFELAPLAMLAVMFGVLLILGMFMEQISMMLLTVPVFYPLIISLGFDPIWFGILVVVVVEISLITPPIGLNVFILNAVLRDVQLTEIFRGVVPFIVADVARVLLVVFIPALSLTLPYLLK